MAKKKYVVPLKEAITGVLHGRAGTFRILMDEETSGARHFSLLVNTMNAGVRRRRAQARCGALLVRPLGKGTHVLLAAAILSHRTRHGDFRPG